MPNVIETTDATQTTATTYTLGIGQTAQGVITALGDHDWYRVNLVAGQTYTFALVGTSATSHLGDTYLALRNAAGTIIAQNDDDGPGVTSSITFTASTTGAYYLDAGAFDNAYTGQYGLSATLGTRASFDEQMGAGILIRDEAFWTAPGTGANLTWAVQATLDNITDAGGNATTGITLSDVQVTAVRAGLAAFSEVGNVTFTQVNPGGTSDNAVMRFAAYDSTTDGSGAYAYFPGSTDFTALAGDVRLNNDSVSTTSIPQGSYSYAAIMHEIGHAMGLAHPGDYNAAPGVSITYEANAQFTQDSYQYTIMSYFDEEATTDDFQSTPDTLMLFDILAIQQAYGANMSTRAGNSTYGFGANTGDTYNFAVNTRPALCIWDGGGIDTINASGYAMAQLVNLTAGSFSTIGGIAGNVSIAYGAVIENATGGSGDDTLIGNAAANVLRGGAGADNMYGGAGADTYHVEIAGDVVFETAAVGIDTVNAAISYGLGANVENLTLTGSAAINGIGNTLANFLLGNAANNVLNGVAGADRMQGLGGADTYYVDNVGDVVIEQNVVGIDKVNAAITWTLGSYVENLTLTGAANINGTGNTLANTIVGNAGNNIIIGGGGADRLQGAAGSDTYYVDNVGDVVVELNAVGTDRVISTITWTLGAEIENLTLAGSAGINATGNTLANTIVGNAGANLVRGGAGADRLYGGTGADTFVYGATTESSVSASDRLYDLTNTDRIDLSAIDANSSAGGNQAFSIVNAFTHVAGQMTLDYAAATALTTILMDINGDGVADMKIVVTGNHEAFTNFVF